MLNINKNYLKIIYVILLTNLVTAVCDAPACFNIKNLVINANAGTTNAGGANAKDGGGNAKEVSVGSNNRDGSGSSAALYVTTSTSSSIA